MDFFLAPFKLADSAKVSHWLLFSAFKKIASDSLDGHVVEVLLEEKVQLRLNVLLGQLRNLEVGADGVEHAPLRNL